MFHNSFLDRLLQIYMKLARQKSIPTEGSWITIETYGDPDVPGLVMVPGVMSDARAWEQVASAVNFWPSVTVINRRGRIPSGPLTAAYSIEIEVSDLGRAIDDVGGAAALFGWSYGGLVVLMASNTWPVDHLIAYEPVMRPFALDILPQLESANADRDWDRSVEIVNRRISGLPADHVRTMRANQDQWQTLRRLSEPLYAETRALNDAAVPEEFATQARRVDLIIGTQNMATPPYGTSFEDVRQRITHPVVHLLVGQGHLAHVYAPDVLANCINFLGRKRAGRDTGA